jgi:hypothetical protein
MPLITPEDVISYSVFEKVKSRSSSLLVYDILQAENDIFIYCGHQFNDTEAYPEIPQTVKLACIKLAEYYALINSDESITKGIKSESLKSYSYTLADGSTVEKPSITSLLQSFVKSGGTSGKGKVRLKIL